MSHLVRLIKLYGLLLLMLLPSVLLSAAASQPAMQVVYLFCFAIILFFFIRLWLKSPVCHCRPISPRPAITASISALLAILSVGPIYDALAVFFGISTGSHDIANQQALAQMIVHVPILAALHIIIYAPLSEEILFRGLFLRLAPHFPTAMMFISAILFASLHAAPNSWDFVPYFIMGSIFGALYLYTGQLRYSLAVHAINNLFGYIALWFDT